MLRPSQGEIERTDEMLPGFEELAKAKKVGSESREEGGGEEHSGACHCSMPPRSWHLLLRRSFTFFLLTSHLRHSLRSRVASGRLMRRREPQTARAVLRLPR